MKRIWLVRHGQSKSQSGEDDDTVNPELSSLGEQQAKRLIEPLKDTFYDVIIISPLKRAWQTYELSEATSEYREFDSRAIESNWGIEGWYREILPLKTPNVARQDKYDAWLEDVEARASEFLQHLLNRPESQMLVFGHWGIFNTIFHLYTGSMKTIMAPMNNTGISLLEVDENQNRFIRFWNEHSHVKDLID
jgi:broad specificity phosphatase PhoE